jgi:molybdenum cofactor biosynthesis enzyme MoaA
LYRDEDISVRIAGAGDPTMVGPLELCDLISRLKQNPQISRVKLTTNGVKIASMVDDLYDSGLDGITVSLNSTSKIGFIKYAQHDKLDDVLVGLKAIVSKGIPLKINVIYSVINQNELCNYLDLSKELGIVSIKFFDLIPTPKTQKYYLSLDRLEEELRNHTEDFTDHTNPYPTRSYFLKNGLRIDIKLAGNINLCPNTACGFRKICLEGCRYSSRIGLDGFLRPCGVRNDNIINLLSSETTDEMIWNALYSGGKIGWD